ncbi:MAG TPA: efflux RND transporter permease subunit [Pseudomonadales bacterium]|nr:efflux RND transporter permease subunit [Pseudomonadales bacterium]
MSSHLPNGGAGAAGARNFATWSIRQPIPPIVAFILLTLAGIYGFQRLNVTDLPDMDFPAVTVTATLQGASASQLETEVTRKIENAVATIGDIEHITSSVTEGTSSTTIMFHLEKNLFEALNDVRASVSNIRADLPSDLEEPVVTKVNTAGMPILTFSVASDRMDEEALSWFVDDTVSRTLLSVPGVGRVSRVGGVDREVRIELNPTQLAALNLSAAEVSRQLRRIQQQLSGGRAEIGDSRQSLRTLATVNRADDLGALDITFADGRHLRLDQIATISDTIADRSQLALLDGQPVVCVQVMRSRGTSAITVADAVTKAIEKIGETNPSVKFTLVNDNVTMIRQEYNASMNMLWEGAVLAIAVVFLFLRDWRATLVSASALPLSIVPTFAAMYWLGFSMNTVTLLALSLVIGLLVDDAIVEVENIVRHLRNGKPPVQAAMDAATEIGLAVIATSMTLVAVFLPTAMMGGIPGLIFKQFGWTAVVAVLASLTVARLITPMLAARFLSHHEGEPEKSRLLDGYLKLAAWSLHHRRFVMIAATLFFLASVALVKFLPTSFLSASDRSQTQLTVEIAPGSTLAETRKVVDQVLDITRTIPEVQHVFTAIGASAGGSMRGPPTGAGPADLRKASMLINLSPRRERERSQVMVENELREKLRDIPGARFTLGYGGNGEKVQLVLSGEDNDKLQQAARDVVKDLRAMPGLGNVTSTASLLRPEILITPDFARAAELGVTASSIGETVHVATAGDYDQALPKLNLPDRQVDIRVQLPYEARRDLATLEQMRVPARDGLVPLSSVAKVTIGSGPAQIDRFDRNRNVTIDAELGGLPLGDVSRAIDQMPSIVNLPAGIRKIDSGDGERMKELFGSFGLAMVTGVVCVYMVLVLLFKDFTQPITILAALPLSVGGAFLALLLCRQYMSMPAMIGLLMLMGITTKNSILLVEYAIVAMRDRGMSQTEALLDACRKRARPIVMTTLAMIAGMMPVALGIDADVSFRSPMAIAVIGGLITSTALSLVVVPVVFTYVYKVQTWLRTIIKPLQHTPAPTPTPVAPAPAPVAHDGTHAARPNWSEPSPIRQRSAR